MFVTFLVQLKFIFQEFKNSLDPDKDENNALPDQNLVKLFAKLTSRPH